MFLIKFQTAHKIATIKAIRGASRSGPTGEHYSLRYSKNMVEFGAYVPDHDMVNMATLIATAYDNIQQETPGSLGGQPTFTVTIEHCSPKNAPVNFDRPDLVS